MQIEQSNNKIKRKKFFTSIGSGFLGYFVLKSFPLSLLNRKRVSGAKKVTIKINPEAISRKKIGSKNV